MSNETKLGTIPKGDEGRDAVHVAIVPTRAGERLWSGEPIKINADNRAIVCALSDAIGVVDPFSKDRPCVEEGGWFWLCLYPKTITGLRHVWDHPAFAKSEISGTQLTGNKSESEAWLKNYVRLHCPYAEDEEDHGYAEFLRHVKQDRWVYYHGEDCHCLADVDDAEELFRHLGIVLDLRIDASYFEAFTCSC